MADIKISQLGEALAVTDNDILPMTASGVTSKVKASTMKSYMVDDLDVSDLHDTTITTPIDDDGLVYNGTSQKWENKQITTKEQWQKNGAYNIAPNDITSQVLNGVTVVKNANNTVTLNNTVVSPGFTLYAFNKIQIPDGTYKLVGCTSGASDNFRMTLLCNNNNTSKGNDTGSGLIFTYNASTDINLSLYLWVKTGYTCDNVVFKPMITTDLNATYADYVEYAKTNRELTEDALTANDVAFVKEAFNLQANSSKTITLKTTVSLLVGVYGSNGFAYLIHDNGGVYQIANSNDGISASLSTHTLTITNSGTHSYRTRLLELGQS